MIGQEIQACCVVGAGTVTRGVGSGRGIPPGSRSQFLGGTCTRVGNQFAPFRIARDMPTHRTDTSHTARIGRRGGSSVHSHCPSIGFSCIGSIGTRSAVGDGRVVGGLGHFEVLLEPALRTDHHSVVGVAVNVSDGGQARAGLAVLYRVESLGFTVGCVNGVDGKSTVVVLSVGGKAGNSGTRHRLRQRRISRPSVFFHSGAICDRCRSAHHKTILGNRHTAVVGDFAAQNPGTVLGDILGAVDSFYRRSIHCIRLTVGIVTQTTDRPLAAGRC